MDNPVIRPGIYEMISLRMIVSIGLKDFYKFHVVIVPCPGHCIRFPFYLPVGTDLKEMLKITRDIVIKEESLYLRRTQ